MKPAVDAIFFCNDDLAQGALLAAQRLRLAVPKRLAIVGFNDLTGSDQMVPALTTVRTPRGEIGQRAAQMLLTLMRGGTPRSAASTSASSWWCAKRLKARHLHACTLQAAGTATGTAPAP